MSKNPVHHSHVDQCYEILRGMIVRCEIAPGARLTERDLIERLGFGRTPVREALLRLNQDRIVDTKPRSGYRVRPVTYKSVEDFFTVWRVVAPLLAELAFRKLTDQDRKMLTELGERSKLLATEDVEGFREVSSGFFDHLVKVADSEPIAFIYHRFGAEMDRVFRIFVATPEGRAWVARSGLIEWLQSSRPEEAAAVISDAVGRVQSALLAYIEASLKAGNSMFSSEEA